MKSTEFKAWMGLIERNQEDKPACPYCRASNLYRWGKASELQRYMQPDV